MTTITDFHGEQTERSISPSPVVRKVRMLEPFAWLAAGVRTWLAAPGASLVYGAVFALAVGLALYLTREMPGFGIAFLTGLLLIGPFIAAGLYTAARQQERGEPTSMRAGFALVWRRISDLSLFALFLGLIMAAWVRFSALLFAVKFTTASPSIDGYLGLLSGSGDPVVLAYFVGIGFVLAVTVFVTSAVAIPMILDRECGPVTAVQASAKAVVRNWPAMVLWAALIVALSMLGIVTFLVGMVVIFPLLGYATWHSYRSLLG